MKLISATGLLYAGALTLNLLTFWYTSLRLPEPPTDFATKVPFVVLQEDERGHILELRYADGDYGRLIKAVKGHYQGFYAEVEPPLSLTWTCAEHLQGCRVGLADALGHSQIYTDQLLSRLSQQFGSDLAIDVVALETPGKYY